MNDRQEAKSRDGRLYRVFHSFGRDFAVRYRYSEADGQALPEYPDFEQEPQYTADGRPFVLVAQEGCADAAADDYDDKLGDKPGAVSVAESGGELSKGPCRELSKELCTELSAKLSGECGSCRYFRQEAGFSIVGICMNNKRRQQNCPDAPDNKMAQN